MTRPTLRSQPLEMGDQFGGVRRDAEAEHMERLTLPACRDLDPGDEPDPGFGTGCRRRCAAGCGVVVGERRKLDAAGGDETHQCGRVEHPV